MWLFLRTAVSVPVTALVLAAFLPATSSAQERRGLVFGHVGIATIGHADSEQGTAPIFGGGIAIDLARRVILDVDVHGARLEHVFGREHQDFDELTATASVLYRAFADRRVHLLAGGGLGVQRAHSAFDLSPATTVDSTEIIRLWHWRAGAEWDISRKLVIRPDAVFWFGEGLDWVMGGRLTVGYRF